MPANVIGDPGENAAPPVSCAPTPGASLASSFRRNVAPPIWTVRLPVRRTALVSGSKAAERCSDQRLRASMVLMNPSTAFSTEEGRPSARDNSK